MVDEAAVLALQRALVEAALMPDPGPLVRDPAGFAAERGLPPGDQAAFLRFRDRLLVYRDMVRADLMEPVASICYVTRALLEQAGTWAACETAFLASRSVDSVFCRDLPAVFVGWLAASGWGQDRWPFLLQLAHCEMLSAVVAHHPGHGPDQAVHGDPHPADRLVLAVPTQVVSYGYQVHLVNPEQPIPAPGTVHLMAYRDADGLARWLELTPASAALVLGSQQASISRAARDLGLADLGEALDLLRDLRAKGAARGFAGPA